MSETSFQPAPWSDGPREDGRAATVATGVGSLPGTDMAEAVRLVFGELPDLPHLPELPARGVGADLIGRSAALLVDLPVELATSSWRIADAPGRDARRALSMLRADLDLLEEQAQGYAGPLKIQVAGPWTLAASIELRHGDKMLADPGAYRDLAGSLAEGVAAHVAELRRRLPGVRVLAQLDEPALPGVLAGTVPTASGFGRLRAVEEPVAEQAIAGVVDSARAAGAPTVLHCCAPNVPLDLARRAGVAGISFDLDLVEPGDTLAEVIDGGMALLLGVVPGVRPAATAAGKLTARQVVERVLALGKLGFGERRIADQVALTPSCGLAGADAGWVRTALPLLRDAARALADTE